VENLCKNTARVIRPFFLGALRETWGVEKKTGGWEEQSSYKYLDFLYKVLCYFLFYKASNYVGSGLHSSSTEFHLITIASFGNFVTF
jgi:hypothetical protein